MARKDLNVNFLAATGFNAELIESMTQQLQLRRQRIANGDTTLAELVAAENDATTRLLSRMEAYMASLIPSSIEKKAILASDECQAYQQCRAALASYEATRRFS